MTNMRPGIWKLRIDVAVAKILVWTASVGRDADWTPNTHLYFADRYQLIANYHRKHGNRLRAVRFQAKAFQHYKLGGGDKSDGPFAAAMGMPRPRQWVITNAVSGREPDDAA